MTSIPFDSRHNALVSHAQHLFTKKQPILSLWQEMAENFYPERAEFTILNRSPSYSFAENLSTSRPMLIRRELTVNISAMLRPPGEQWFNMTTDREDKLDVAGRQWLEAKNKVMGRAMSDRPASFIRATSEADADFVTFGQAVISLEVNRVSNTLLYRTWHLRDVAWCEKFDGSIGARFRKWKPTARDVVKIWPNTAHANVINSVTNANGKDAYREIELMHMVVPVDEYDMPIAQAMTMRFPWVSIWVDVQNKCVLEETNIATGYYIIPRWQTASGSQYAHSPATVAALPDARLLQSITFTLLKAGEKAVDPPMLAVQDAIKSPIDIQPGGVTFTDYDYDEKTGEVLKLLQTDSRGIPVGFSMQDRIDATIVQAFFLDKLRLPESTVEMTAYEVSKRLQEYIRQALPLFGPIEQEYNAPLCEDTFTLLRLNGAFGGTQDIPESLRGANVRFKFQSPLVDAADQQLVQTFTDTANLLGIAAAMDPGTADIIDPIVAMRETLKGRQVPASWFRTEEDAAAMGEKRAQQQQMSQQLAIAQQGADVVNTGAQAAAAFKQGAQ